LAISEGARLVFKSCGHWSSRILIGLCYPLSFERDPTHYRRFSDCGQRYATRAASKSWSDSVSSGAINHRNLSDSSRACACARRATGDRLWPAARIHLARARES
jgi:hypothetical protein